MNLTLTQWPFHVLPVDLCIQQYNTPMTMLNQLHQMAQKMPSRAQSSPSSLEKTCDLWCVVFNFTDRV